jgi:hypothetical protein
LDSDDEWTPDRNRQFLAAAARLPENVAWIFGDTRVVTDDSDSTTLYSEYGLSVTECPHIFADSLSVQYPFMFGLLQSSFIRRKVLLELTCFDEGLQSSEDLFAAFQVACRYRFAAIPSVVGRRILTSDLAATSASVAGVLGPDYYRARMLAFALVVESGRRHPWNQYYADSVRGLCQALTNRGQIPRRLAMQQFRFGSVSAKGVGFTFAVLLGRIGIRTWNALAAFRRKYLCAIGSTTTLKKHGHRGWAESLGKTTSVGSAR